MTEADSVAILREQVESMVVVATGRVIRAADLRDCGGSLERAGVNSIAYINIIEALQRRHGVVIDPEQDAGALTSVDSIVELIRSAGGAR